MGLVNLWRIKTLYDRITEGRRHPARLADPAYWIRLYRAAWAVEEVRTMLAGYKTYIIAALVAAVTVAQQLGYLDAATAQTLLGLLGAGGLATLRAGVTKNGR